MSADRRFLAAGLAVAAAEAVLALVAMPTGLGPYLLATAAATAVLTAAMRRLLVPPPSDPGDGGPGVVPGEPSPPPWWPGFEAAFRSYADDRRPDRVPG
jgi:hypothetical protein